MLNGTTVLLIACATILAYLALQRLWSYFAMARDANVLYAGLFALSSCLFVTVRLCPALGLGAPYDIFFIRLRIWAIYLTVFCGVAVYREFAQPTASAKAIHWAMVLYAAMLPLVAFTPLFVESGQWDPPGGTMEHTFGALYYPSIVAVLALCISALVHLERVSRRISNSRRMLGRLFLIVLAVGIHDSLVSAGVLTTPRLLEVGLVVVSVTWSLSARRELVQDFASLEVVVSNRTAELQDKHAELEETHQQLVASEARFRLLSDAAFEGLLLHEEGRVIDTNARCLLLFGLSRDALLGRDVTSLFEPDAHRRVDAMVSGNQQGPREARARRSDGTFVDLEIMGHHLVQSDTYLGVLAVRDVSERKAMHAQMLLADRMASLGSLAAGTAHEINNPLTYTTESLSYARQTLDQVDRQQPDTPLPRVARAIDTALEGCERIAKAVATLQELANPDAETARVNVAALLDSSLQLVEKDLRDRATVVRNYEEVPPIKGNAAQLGQVFLNLLLNAHHAIPLGKTVNNEIRVGLYRSTNQDQVVLEVSDTGVGIAAEDLPRIFDPYFSTKPVGTATGLGLAICQQVVSQHQGTIEVDSSEGQGTTIRVTLPLAPDRTPVPKVLQPIGPTEYPLSILIVDDEPLVARSLVRYLREHETTVAHDGQGAIDLCRGQRFDLVLCDLMMPGVSGMEFYQWCQNNSPEQAQRVYIVTGGAYTADGQLFIKGFDKDRIINKPVGQDILRQVISSVSSLPRPAPTGAHLSVRASQFD
jgi:PAS domain S-box-containing protein